MTLLKAQNIWNRFQQNHPKFPLFLKAVSQDAIREGTVIEISITTAEGQNYASNLKIKPEDIELIGELKSLRQ